MKCVKCNAEIEGNVPFCGYCGAKVEQIQETTADIKRCKVCNEEIKDGERFCGSCGAAVEQVIVEPKEVVEPVMEGSPTVLSNNKKKPIMIGLIILILIGLGLAVYFIFIKEDKKEDKKPAESNSTTNTNVEEVANITIDTEWVEDNVGYGTYIDYHIYIKEEALKANIEFTVESYYGDIDKKFDNVDLKLGLNEFLLTDPGDEDRYLYIYLTGKEMDTDITSEVEEVFKEVQECDYSSDCSERVRFDTIAAEMTNNKTSEIDYENTDGKYIECESEYCETLEIFTSYVKDKYNFSSRYADEYVKGFINHEDLKIDNDKLMFKSLSVYGFEGSSEYEYFAHTIKGDKLQIFALASYNMMGEIDTEDPEEMVFNFVKEEGEYRFDGYNYMGHEYIIK